MVSLAIDRPDRSRGDSTNRGKPMSRAELARLWTGNTLSAAEIGKTLGISGAAVGWRAKALGLPARATGPKHGFDPESELFQRMWRANVRPSEMGRFFGVREQAINWNARKLGMTRDCNRHNSIGLAEFAAVELAARMAQAAATERAQAPRRLKS